MRQPHRAPPSSGSVFYRFSPRSFNRRASFMLNRYGPAGSIEPQRGQLAAVNETDCPQSWQLINSIAHHLEASFWFRLQPKLYKPANGFRATRRIVLHARPGVDRFNEFVGKADCTRRIDAGWLPTGSGPFSASRLRYCVFHFIVLRFSSLKNKRPAAVLETP